MRFRRRSREEGPSGGEDSFLDIVANLVGILIILVTVIGVRAQDAWEEQVDDPTPRATELTAQRQQAEAEHNNLAVNVHEVQHKTEELATLVARRQRERHQLQVLMTAARMELEERRQQLSQQQQEQVAFSAEASELADELRRVEAQRRVLEQEGTRPIELEHLPTPLARTVFGSEEHFRLKGGRLVYVPLNELTDLLRQEAPQKAPRLREVPQITETIGPVQGFHLRYTMHRRAVETGTAVGPVVRQIAELKQFILVPMSEQMGEPVADALELGSQFRQLIETMRPGATVITVWTYPDSFGDFRELKKWLFDRGFATAARPLPDGQPISGSPTGSRSAAQ
jgi:multidrug efflux pump subunit AcrA (membrane-fusion protein)